MKNFVIWLAVIVLVAAAVFGIPRLLQITLGTQEPMLTVISDSMWPLLQRGDVVFVEKATPADIKVGTVIIFHHSGGLAIHRVVSIQGDAITTKGDANSVDDNPITYADVVGRAPVIAGRLAKIPWVGNIALAMNPQAGEGSGEPAQGNIVGVLRRDVTSPVGFVVIVILPLLLFFSSYLLSAFSGLTLRSTRKQRERVLRQRLSKRCGEAHARRVLRY